MNLPLLLQLAGVMHVGLLGAGVLMPGVTGLPQHLARVPVFIRRLMWVYYGFIGASLLCYGSLSFFMADELSSGAPLARAVCGYLALFWTARLLVAAFVFDLRPYLTTRWRILGYHATNLAFALLPVIYAAAALRGGRP